MRIARLTFQLVPFYAFLLVLSACKSGRTEEGSGDPVTVSKPNILFCIADDASFPHMSAYGCSWVKTPAFDRVAAEGLLFMNAYTPNAKCAPSRSCILTGRNSWQLEEAANHSPVFPAEFSSFIEILGTYGYETGYTGKGWAPGNPGIKGDSSVRELTGKAYNSKNTKPPTEFISATDYAANFRTFLGESDPETPWCFWYGGKEPHRYYEYGSGIAKGGKQLEDIPEVPAFWPDNEVVRTDMLDYAYEIEHFDKHLGLMLDILDSAGILDNTIIVVTSDNGMPFPRVKGQEYELSNHLPLAMMWPVGIESPGRKIEELVSFIDFAPTFLELAGIDWSSSGMQPSPGLSLTKLLDGADSLDREFVVFGKERHDVGRPDDQGYPIRGIVNDEYLYLKNYEPSRWPVGNPETGYLNTDGGATKTVILEMRRSGQDENYWQMNFGKRPPEEFYNIIEDPECLKNLADDPEFLQLKHKIKEQLFGTLRAENDPRMYGKEDYFEKMRYHGQVQGLYERYMNGEKVPTGWVNDSDYEKDNYLSGRVDKN